MDCLAAQIPEQQAYLATQIPTLAVHLEALILSVHLITPAHLGTQEEPASLGTITITNLVDCLVSNLNLSRQSITCIVRHLNFYQFCSQSVVIYVDNFFIKL